MTVNNQTPGLADAATIFMADLSPEKRGVSQKEISDFVRWFGRERDIAAITPAEIGNYAERLSLSATDYDKKLEIIRGFLLYAKKKGWSKTNLATHLKTKKGKSGSRASSGKKKNEAVPMTQEGYDKMVAELEALKNTSIEVIEEIRKAAADKDFRENAPLHAARERRGQIEGRIMEMEAALKAAVIVDKTKDSGLKVGLGNNVILRDVDSGAEVRYTLVGSSEVDPANGKISGSSPIGKSIIDREQGETVEISTPAGKLHYQIIKIER